MRTSFHVIRVGPLLALLVLLAGIPAAHAGGKTPAHHYAIRGSLESVATSKSAASQTLRVNARLSAPSKDVGLLSGGDFVVLAKLAESPLGCGSDIIFTNGFDGGI
jgi:hypothetical protein